MAHDSLAAHVVAGRLDEIMARRKRPSREQIVHKLLAANRLLAGAVA
ncbi:hypothetical protein [Mycolicibacterium fluoranthenivorans]|uniref:Uncharacterized protein n=1 Tax=Mycolicibacterium fluoranthenivorans TaxID=258505 RepID=A0A1G4WGM8_9MYCO|nr:hypothetical protein [Mycolicibacterium fluoranthenivorans]SCX21888.1 hypothetical protein SAMN02799620_03114 [Mycolicibacterium fluoranthenivorans]